jgi:hypothetical protein
METFRSLAAGMDPDEALSALAKVVRDLLAQVDQESRLDFVRQFTGDAGGDKVSSLVHL